MTPTACSQASSPSKPTSTPSTSNEKPLSQFSNSKPTVAILGTGWAGWTLAQDLGRSSSFLSTNNLLILSPARTMALTPLLASAACSIFDFRIAEEPVRRLSLGKDVIKYQVWCEAVDFDEKVVRCRAAVGSNGAEKVSEEKGEKGNGGGEREREGMFEVQYDKLILAPGAEVNTFDTPGVRENCLFSAFTSSLFCPFHPKSQRARELHGNYARAAKIYVSNKKTFLLIFSSS
jgi:NADH:ubiquinone reductase (non-electrogenic)